MVVGILLQNIPLHGRGDGEQGKQDALTLRKHVCREHANKPPLHQQFQGPEFKTSFPTFPSKHTAFVNMAAVQNMV